MFSVCGQLNQNTSYCNQNGVDEVEQVKNKIYDVVIKENKAVSVFLPESSSLKYCQNVIFGNMRDRGSIYDSEPFFVSFKHGLGEKIFEKSKNEIDFTIEIHAPSETLLYDSKHLLLKFNRELISIHSVTAEKIVAFIHGSVKANQNINIPRATLKSILENRYIEQAKTIAKRLWVCFDAKNRTSLAINILCLPSNCFNHAMMKKWHVELDCILRTAEFLKLLNPESEVEQSQFHFPQVVVQTIPFKRKHTNDQFTPSKKVKLGKKLCADRINVCAEDIESNRETILFMDCDWLRQGLLDISGILQTQGNLAASQKINPNFETSSIFEAANYKEMHSENESVKVYSPRALGHFRNCIIGSYIQNNSDCYFHSFVVDIDVNFFKNYTIKLENVALELHGIDAREYQKQNRILKFPADQVYIREVNDRLKFFVHTHRSHANPHTLHTCFSNEMARHVFKRNELSALDQIGKRLWVCFNSKSLNISAKVVLLENTFTVATRENMQADVEQRRFEDLLKRWNSHPNAFLHASTSPLLDYTDHMHESFITSEK